MGYQFGGRTLTRVGVVGCGQIGPDIALHFSKVLASSGTTVVVVDVSDAALEAGRAKLTRKVEKGVASGAFKPAQAEQIVGNVSFTSDYEALAGASFVLEAATEDIALKRRIFTRLEDLCGADTLLCSNSSHLEPEAIFEPLARPERTAVVHYFFPAERNRVVEVVPGANSSPETTRFLLGFYEAIGKVPIRVGSRYGYAIDPVFEGLLQTAALLAEAGVASTKEIDAVATSALGLGVGPFTAHNLTGGNPITAHGLANLHEKVSPWFNPPASLLEKVDNGEAWEVPARGEKLDIPSDRAARVAEALEATFHGLCCEVVDAGISNVADLEMAVEMALVIDAPFAAMNRRGTAATLSLVRAFANEHPGFPVARCLEELGARDRPWEIPYVQRDDRQGVAVLTIRRPKVLNALNAEVFAQLEAHIEAIERDESIEGAVITGFGNKAFVSGADVGFLARIETPEQGVATCLESQRPLNRIAALEKPVVCAMNGLAFGGGNELAMACHARLCRKGLRVLAGQPEPNLGIIPGAGGTQRLPRLVGFEHAAKILRLGKPISSAEAVEIGLVRAEIEGELLDAACDLVRSVASGKETLEPMAKGPLSEAPDSLEPIDLGHLSRAVDALLCRAILEGARLTLADGLRREAELFGEVVKTTDMGIGIENFLNNGPRKKAAFIHE